MYNHLSIRVVTLIESIFQIMTTHLTHASLEIRCKNYDSDDEGKGSFLPDIFSHQVIWQITHKDIFCVVFLQEMFDHPDI